MILYFGFQMKKMIKNLKPIEIEANLVYLCPSCSCKHWLSLKEAKTKRFIVVCDCDTKFTVKTIQKIKISYKQKNKLQTLNADEQKNHEDKTVELLNKSYKILAGYGFSKEESGPLVKKAYEQNPSASLSDIIKFCLVHIGDKK
jgi:stalled ribosome rescue protein Dom34